MKSIILTIALLLSAAVMAETPAARQAIAVDLVNGKGSIQGLRLAYRPYDGKLDFLQEELSFLGDLGLYWEISLNIWEYDENGLNETVSALAVSPVFTGKIADIADRYPLKWEFGIGFSVLDDSQFAGEDLGIHFQFEDRLGLIMEFGEQLEQSVTLRYMHYSNAGLSEENPGLDFLTLSYAYKF